MLFGQTQTGQFINMRKVSEWRGEWLFKSEKYLAENEYSGVLFE